MRSPFKLPLRYEDGLIFDAAGVRVMDMCFDVPYSANEVRQMATRVIDAMNQEAA
jgi:hypothetical protein